MKLKNLLISAASLLVMVSCGSSKVAGVSEDTEINVPCSGAEFFPDSDHYRSSGMGFSNNLEIASQKAMTTTRVKLAASIETTLKTVTDNYISSYEENMTEEARGRFQSLTREVVDQQIKGARVICSKTTKTAEGMYKCYVTLELSTDVIPEAVQKEFNKDSKVRTDFEYEKYREVYEQEIEKL